MTETVLVNVAGSKEKNRLQIRSEIIEKFAIMLDKLTDDEFSKLTGNGHEAWLESELNRAICRVTGKSTIANSSICA